jgi:hypothetical protein
MAKFLSSTQRNLTIGIQDYTNFETVLTVIGNTNITGNLFVAGDKFLIDSENFTLRDPLIELGLIVDPNTGELVPPAQDLGNDVGVVLNYFDTDPTVNSAQKAAMYYDNDDDRMKFVRRASLIGNNVVASAYAALEIGSLWLNDCAGQSQVISCDNGERLLENISIDCGIYV